MGTSSTKATPFATCRGCCGHDEIACGNATCLCTDMQEEQHFAAECSVQKVLVQRAQHTLPMLGWFAGQQESLVVEIVLEQRGSKAVARRTKTGKKVEATKTGQETWVWGEPWRTESGVSRYRGENLEFTVRLSSDLRVRVLSSSAGLFQAKTNTEELLGEARCHVRDDVVPSERLSGVLSLPLVQDSRVQGTVWLAVKLRRGEGVVAQISQPVVTTMRGATGGPANRALTRLKGHRGAITGCALFPGGERVLTVSEDRCGIIWSAASGEQLTVLLGHSAPLLWGAVFPTALQVMTVSDDATGIIWSAAGKQLSTLSGVRLAKLFPSGEKVLAAMEGESGAIFSSSGEQVATLLGHSKPITALAVLPSEEQVVTASEDEEGILWTTQGDTVRVLRGHAGAITCCSPFPSGDQLLTGSQDATAIVWNTGSRAPLAQQLRGHSGPLTCCAVFPLGDRVFTGGEDGHSILWSIVDSAEQLMLFSGHTAPLRRALVFPEGDRLFTVSEDRLGMVWSPSGQMLGCLQGHGGGIEDALVYPSGRHVVTASADRTAVIWPVALFVEAAAPRAA